MKDQKNNLRTYAFECSPGVIARRTPPKAVDDAAVFLNRLPARQLSVPLADGLRSPVKIFSLPGPSRRSAAGRSGGAGAKTLSAKVLNLLAPIKATGQKGIWFCHYLSWLFRYLRQVAGFNVLRDIKILSIEFSSICNLHCKYCYIEKNTRPKFLELAVYEKLIKEVSENLRYRIKTMEWPISGEFLVYPEFRKVVDITRRYMDENPHFSPHIILNENLVLFDEEKIDFILRSGTIRQIICSLDGHDAESFERLRPSAKFPIVLRNMKSLIRMNKELGHPVILQINNGRDEESLKYPLSAQYKEFFKAVDDVRFWVPKQWNESFHKEGEAWKPAKGFCTFVFNNVSLSASGSISKCCMDLKGATDYADLREHSLSYIWHSQARRQFLGLMFRNQRGQLNGCKTCSITNTNNDNRYQNIFRTLRRQHFRKIGRRRILSDRISQQPSDLISASSS